MTKRRKPYLTSRVRKNIPGERKNSSIPMARKTAARKSAPQKVVGKKPRKAAAKKPTSRTRTGFRRVSFDADGRHIVFQRKKKPEKTLAQKIASIKARIKAPAAQERAIRIAKGEIDFYGRPKKPKADAKAAEPEADAEVPAAKPKRAPRRKTAKQAPKRAARKKAATKKAASKKAAPKNAASSQKPAPRRRRKKSSGSLAASFSWNW